MEIYRLIHASLKPIPSTQLLRYCWMDPSGQMYDLAGFKSHEEWANKVMGKGYQVEGHPVPDLLKDKWARVSYIGRELMVQVYSPIFLSLSQKKKLIDVAFQFHFDKIVMDVWGGGDRVIWERE